LGKLPTHPGSRQRQTQAKNRDGENREIATKGDGGSKHCAEKHNKARTQRGMINGRVRLDGSLIVEDKETPVKKNQRSRTTHKMEGLHATCAMRSEFTDDVQEFIS